MADLFGQALYPGVPAYIECSYTCSHGVSPGRATLVVDGSIALANVADMGDLQITDGPNSLTIKRCKIVDALYSIGPRGPQLSLFLEDRRWWWQFPTISGLYNVIADEIHSIPVISQDIQPGGAGGPQGNPDAMPDTDPKGEEPIRPETKKTAPELATLCLQAMGETQYDLSGLDSKTTPSVHWDVTNAALALQSLVEDLGCRVVYDVITDTVRILKLGEGADLPGGPILDDAPELKAGPRPEKLTLNGAHSRYQQRFALEAVGVDFDGKLLPIDELSYAPTGGWTKSFPPYYANLLPDFNLGGRTQEDAVALASQCVFRYYRVVFEDDDGTILRVPPVTGAAGKPNELKYARQLRLLPVRNERSRDEFHRPIVLPAQCFGKHTPPQAVSIGGDIRVAYDQTTPDQEVKVTFHVDADRQLIVFSDYVYAIHSDGTANPAELYLECAAELADPTTNQYKRYQRELPIPDGTTGLVASFVREDVRFRVVAQYDDKGVLKGLEDNKDDIEARADYFLASEVRQYLPTTAETKTYPGIKLIPLDGAIHQLTWAVGGGSPDRPQTRASRNTEHNLRVPTFDARRRIESTNLDTVRRNIQFGIENRDDANAEAPPEGGV